MCKISDASSQQGNQAGSWDQVDFIVVFLLVVSDCSGLHSLGTLSSCSGELERHVTGSFSWIIKAKLILVKIN